MSKKEELTNDQLIEWARNAYYTYQTCHGHNKAARNKARYEEYISELQKRGHESPRVTAMKGIGIFNGPGAS